MSNKFALGRLVQPEDPRNWPIQKLLGVDLIQKPRDKIWPSSVILDQGQSPACTGYSQAITAGCGPIVENPITNHIGDEIYAKAQTLDPWAGTVHEGSTIEAAAKSIMALYPGIYEGYYFCKTMDEVDAALSYVGPVIFGTEWLESMFNVDSADFIVLDKSSSVAGGHAYCIDSINIEKKQYQNSMSWGTDFATRGKAFFHRADLAWLLQTAPNGQALVMHNKALVTIS